MSNRYEITSLIETDYLGDVFLAQDITLQRKVIYRKFNTNPDQTIPEGFRDYSGKLCALQHPNLLTIYDIGNDENGYYMVNQYLEAELLTERLQEGPLSITGVYNMASDLLDALHAIHEMGLYHGALSFESVKRLPRPRGGHRYLIVDLGLQELASMISGQGVAKADTALLSPELLTGDVVSDLHSDLFALGQLCYHALAGVHPMLEKSADECVQAYRDGGMPDLSGYVPDVQPDFDNWVMKMVSSDPNERPASAEEAMATLHAIQLDVAAPNIPGVTQAVAEVAPHVPPHASQPILVSADPSEATGTTTPLGTATYENPPKNTKMMVIAGLLALLVVIIIGVLVTRSGDGSGESDAASISGDGPIFLQKPTLLKALKDEGEPVTVDLDTKGCLDWTIIKGAPSSSERINKEEGAYITSISSHGGFKEFTAELSPVSYGGNGLTLTPRGGMTNVEKGMAEFGHGWDIMLRIPKKHTGAMTVTLYMLQDQCDFDIEVKAHDTDELVKLKVLYSDVNSTPGIVKIPLHIKKPTPGGFYTIQILASSEEATQEFGMGLGAVHVQGN